MGCPREHLSWSCVPGCCFVVNVESLTAGSARGVPQLLVEGLLSNSDIAVQRYRDALIGSCRFCGSSRRFFETPLNYTPFLVSRSPERFSTVAGVSIGEELLRRFVAGPAELLAPILSPHSVRSYCVAGVPFPLRLHSQVHQRGSVVSKSASGKPALQDPQHGRRKPDSLRFLHVAAGRL